MYNELRITALVERGCIRFIIHEHISPLLIKSVWAYGCFLIYLSDILFNSHNHVCLITFCISFTISFSHIIAQL